MVLRDLVGDVLRTLWSHKLRTFLTMFGIAWGIVSIVLMVAAGEGLRQGQEAQARNLGKDILIVFHGRTSMQVGGKLARGARFTGKTQTSPRCRHRRRTVNTQFRSWSRTTFGLTAVTTMLHLP